VEGTKPEKESITVAAEKEGQGKGWSRVVMSLSASRG
jgi:hypothetical protein